MSRSPALFVTGVALALTVAFHFLPASHAMGIPVAIFMVLAAVGIVVIGAFARTPLNRWAAIFLLPAAIAITAEALYANDVTQFLAPLITFGCLVMFAYWLCSPRVSFWSLQRLWPVHFFLDTIFPFSDFDSYAAGLTVGKRGPKILIGVMVSIPFLILFGALFASADPLFKKTLTDLFQGIHLGPAAFKLIRDAIVLFYLTAAGWTMYRRMHKDRRPDLPHTPNHPNVTIITTFLGLVNALFLVFIGFQIPYFFGGQDFIKSQGLVYADYARNGFFQLITVAGIVFVIAWAIYVFTHMRQKWSQLLTVGLIAETGVILVSAVMRLMLYIDAYGLSVSRWWAMASIVIVAVVLSAVLIAAILQTPYHQIAKILLILALFIVSLPLLYNDEAAVVRFNTSRFLAGKTDQLDRGYLSGLSSDAIPELVILYRSTSPRVDLDSLRVLLQSDLRYEKSRLSTYATDWRNLTVSDYQAIAALAQIN